MPPIAAARVRTVVVRAMWVAVISEGVFIPWVRVDSDGFKKRWHGSLFFFTCDSLDLLIRLFLVVHVLEVRNVMSWRYAPTPS